MVERDTVRGAGNRRTAAGAIHAHRQERTALTVLIRASLLLGVLGLLGFRIGQAYRSAHTLCSGSACQGPALTVRQLHVVHSIGLPLDTYGIYAAIVTAIFVGVYGAVALLIVWLRTLAALGARLGDGADLAGVTAGIVTVVQETMEPSHVTLWLPSASAGPADAPSAGA